MMKNLITLSLFMIFLNGCTTVVTKHPIGTEPYFAAEDEWQGTWLTDNEIIKIKVIDESAGSIQIAWIEDNESELKFEKVNCKLMKSENAVYIHSLDLPNEDFGGYYVWGKVQIENNKIIIWEPMFEAFKSVYIEKKLKASVEKNDKQEISNIQLTDTPVNILSVIEADKTFFDWEKPTILMRLFDKKNN